MSAATDKLNAIQVWEQPTQTVVIPHAIREVLAVGYDPADESGKDYDPSKRKPKPTRKPRK